MTATFPNDAPTHECLVRYGDAPMSGTFGIYRFWYTQATSDQWAHAPLSSNFPQDATMVYGDQRVIYNAGVRYAGSMTTSSSYGPVPNLKMCGYAIDFPSDDRLLGATRANIDWPIRDAAAQREQIA